MNFISSQNTGYQSIISSTTYWSTKSQSSKTFQLCPLMPFSMNPVQALQAFANNAVSHQSHEFPLHVPTYKHTLTYQNALVSRHTRKGSHDTDITPDQTLLLCYSSGSTLVYVCLSVSVVGREASCQGAWRCSSRRRCTQCCRTRRGILQKTIALSSLLRTPSEILT